jgi:ATP-independent RNA helicase DbpA
VTAHAFSTLDLNPDLLKNLESLKYNTMTPIQALALPEILAGQDLIGKAKTGSGKTAAFGLGILNKLAVKRFRIQCLVLCPTRELADQVAKEIRQLGRQIHNIKVLTLCGGVPFGPQKGSLEHGAHIIVGTPGRIEDHIRKKTLQLDDVEMFVLDEADRMLDMGFGPVIETITQQLPKQRQTLLFSATYPHNIASLAENVMNEPLMIEVEESHSEDTIRQVFYQIEDSSKRTEALAFLLQKYQPQSALVFCNTKVLTEEVVTELRKYGFKALPLNGDLDQRDREQRLIQFTNQSLTVLVATDVAARGLDIDALDLVVNYHLSRDPEVHTHRIGRTGRAGNSGIACSLYDKHEEHRLAALETSAATERAQVGKLDRTIPAPQPKMTTLQIDGGKKQKVRAGDILGALTSNQQLEGKMIGKITIQDNAAFIAIERAVARQALDILNNGKIKGRKFRARKL